MEIKVQMPFQQLLEVVRGLNFTQKAKLRQQLNEESLDSNSQDDFISYLLAGPVYNKEEIQVIEENKKSIAAWRTKKR